MTIPGLVSAAMVGALVSLVCGCFCSFTSPKSRIFTRPSRQTKMFSGFRSRWTTPLSCAPARPRAIGMAQDSGGAGFLLETAQAIGIGRERGRQGLDGHIAPQAFVARAENFSHPSSAQRGDQFVWPNSGFGAHVHSVALYGRTGGSASHPGAQIATSLRRLASNRI